MITTSEIEQEIKELHQLFQDWFNGEIHQDQFNRLEEVLDDKFLLITPEGQRMTRDVVLKMIKNGYNTQSGRKIWVEKVECRMKGEISLVTYHELSEHGDISNERLSSAVFKFDEGQPNNIKWLHVHETWLDTPKEP